MTNYAQYNSTPLPQLVTSERLVIRATTRADAPFLQRWWNDPAAMELIGDVDGMQYDETDMDTWFRRYVEGQSCARHFVICLRASDNQPIGEFYVSCDDRPACISCTLLIGETGMLHNNYTCEVLKAYADALFSGQGCEAIRVDIRCDDPCVRNLNKEIGFELEHVWANGRFQTMILTQAAYEFRQLLHETG
ncbi:MAG: GNAT family N-acetyltransferase [Anaerolineae bacterium]|nr:GNAT family N-acetyltransferase [Anaerolineae bacterium]